MLNSTSTKREAKSYIARFHPAKKSVPLQAAIPSSTATTENAHKPNVTPFSAPGVNLGTFYGTTKAVEESPVFAQAPFSRPFIEKTTEPLHVALVKIRAPQQLDDTALRGIGLTLSQLTQLGLGCIVVVDCDGGNIPENEGGHILDWRRTIEEADRIVIGVESNNASEARRLDSIIEVSRNSNQSPSMTEVNGGARVIHRNTVLAPLRRGVIPVIASVGYMPSTHTMVPIDADEIIHALTREFAGLQAIPSADEDPIAASERLQFLQKQISLDRIILLDPAGGIPSASRANGSHVFINLEQEFDAINVELRQLREATGHSEPSSPRILNGEDSNAGTTGSTSRSNDSAAATSLSDTPLTRPDSGLSPSSAAEAYVKNMKLLQRTLALLPPSSSALITTPQEAANSGKSNPVPFQPSGVGTRKQRNPLIHNLLTDKPIFSSSLPAGRLAGIAGPAHASGRTQAPPTTFIKRGMPLTILPDPRISAWMAPRAGEARLTLEDPRIDLPRLVHLIDDSFSRKLDVKHYLERVDDRIAGVIIAGEYEGGALLTWETPPGVPDDGSEASRLRKVPYLDKFAVLKRSQGAGGVADIVFNAMVRDCFPNGVCWRSRRDNPVNKWYFERARGTWKIPGSNWTMFWTTEGVVQNGQRFLDYEGVCRSVAPSWADKKAVID